MFTFITTSTASSTPIDMLTPAAAGAQLQLDEAALLSAVNQGLLSAYDLDGAIRFRASDIAIAAPELAHAS